MSMLTQQANPRKYSSVDLQQAVVEMKVFNRPLRSSGGSSDFFGLAVHEAGVFWTENGSIYMIEKGVEIDDDIDFPIRYREGKCRIVEVKVKNIRDWTLVKTVQKTNPDVVTLEDLLDACGSEYDSLTDNCWNGTQRMAILLNKSEEGLPWQVNAIGIGAVVLAGIGAIGAVAGYAMSRDEKKQARKY